MKKHWAEVTRYKDNTKRKRKDTHYIHVGRTCSSERGKATNSRRVLGVPVSLQWLGSGCVLDLQYWLCLRP